MSDEDAEEDGGDESSEGGGGRSFSPLKIGLVVGLPVLLLVGGGLAAYFTGLLDVFFGGDEEVVEEVVAEPEPVAFVELPPLTVNLAGDQRALLQLTVSLEVPDPAMVPQLEAVMPRIIDNFQVFLRELRVEDLSGSRGTARIKEELLTRVNVAVAPARVDDVLFKEMLIQ